MKKRIEGAVGWWLDLCDAGRGDELLAFLYLCERVLMLLAGLWWLYGNAPREVGSCFYALILLPVVVLARSKKS